MGACLHCGEVVAAQNLKDGLCPACFTPERTKDLGVKDKKRVELTKNGKSIKLGLGFDWILFITGVLLGFIAPLLPLVHGDWRGTLKLYGAFVILLIAALFSNVSELFIFIASILFWINWAKIFPKMHLKHLLQSGWKPANSAEEEKLRELGITVA